MKIDRGQRYEEALDIIKEKIVNLNEKAGCLNVFGPKFLKEDKD